jgi:hypothetical protein
MGGARMSAADTDDLLIQALEPGEKIVWSDRPHRISSSALHLLWRRLTTWTGLFSFALLATVAYVFVDAKHRAQAGSPRMTWLDSVWIPLVVGIGAIPLLLEAIRFLHAVARTSSHRYAVTDRGRGIFVLPDVVGTFELPRPELITTRAKGDDEHGDIELGIREVVERSSRRSRKGPRTVVFRAVSYPLVTLETIRAAAPPRGPTGGPGQGPLLT